MKWVYRLGWLLFRAYFFVWYRVRVEGVENVPATGPVLLCANHISNLDPPLVGAMLQRPVVFMAKASLFDIPILGAIIRRHLDAFPVQRGTADRAALRQSLHVLEEGRVLGIFPEGTRSKTGELGQARAGIGFIASKSGAPVVPVGIAGHYRFRGQITVRFGKPIDPAAVVGESRDRELVADTIWSAVSDLVESRL